MYFQASTITMRLLLSTALLVLSVLCSFAQANLLPAGLKIENIANAQFLNETGQRFFAVSQPVTVQILPVYAAQLSPANPLQAAPDEIVVWQHTLTNLGNAEQDFVFDVVDVGGDSGVLKNLMIIHDVNNNGVYDAADVVIQPTISRVSLLANQNMSLLVSAQLPAVVGANSSFLANIKVTSLAPNVPVMSLIDKVYSDAPELKLIKNVNKNSLSLDVGTDKSIVYSLTMQNQGNTSALGSTVNIEGSNVSKIVFEDTLPQGTVLNNINYKSGAGGRILLYHVRGTPEKTYKNYELGTLPDLSTIDKVAIAFDNFAAPQEAIVEIKVEVVTKAVIRLDNQFLAYYSYGNQQFEAYSNVVSTNILSRLFDVTAANAVTKLAGEQVVFNHVISNIGSVNDTYQLSLTNLSNDNGNLENPVIVEDSNNNGIYDVSDIVITQVALAVNQQKTIFVVGTVPNNAKANDVFNTVLNTKSSNTQELKTRLDSVVAVPPLNPFSLNTADDLIRQANQSVVWPHILKNNSTLANEFIFSLNDISNNGKTLDGLALVLDVDGNGVYDPAIDQLITSPIQVNAGASLALLVVATVPASAQQNDVFNIQLSATDKVGNITKTAIDKVIVVSSPVSLTKQVDKTQIVLANGQASLRYTLIAKNTDTALNVEPIAITVEGNNFNKVIMEDKLPTGTQLKDLSFTGNSTGVQVLYRLIGDANNSYRLYQKGSISDLAKVESVALSMDKLLAQQTQTLIVDVSVVQTAIGTVFNNSFNLRYRYASGNTQESSNVVTSTIVSYQAQLSSAPELTLDPKTLAVWPHTLTNTGNLADSYALSLANINSKLQDIMLIHDINNNGVYDQGDKLINSSYRISLNPNQQAAILVTGTIAENSQEGDKLSLDVLATGDSSQQTISKTDTVNVVKIVLQLTKTADKPSIDFKNAATTIDVLTYTLEAKNIGSQALNPINIRINGVLQQKVIFKDALPSNVWLLDENDAANNNAKAVEYSGLGQVLYHVFGTPEHDYVTQSDKPADQKMIDAVVIAHDSFAIGATDSFKLRVNVYNSATGSTINNILHGYYFYGTEVRQSVSQKTPTTVAGSATLGVANEKTKDIAFKLATHITLNGNIYLEAKCAVCNVRPDFIDRLFLEIRSKDSGDVERVVAVETGRNTGVFKIQDSHLANPNALPTRSMKDFPVVSGNYIIETQPHDELTATILWCLDDNDLKRVGSDVKDANGQPVSATIFVDPFGVVFDSQTNAPIAGAVVKLVLVDNGVIKPAEIFDDGGFRCSSPRDPRADADCVEVITTKADGAYRFPLVPPTNTTTTFYRLLITPPAGYAYPSVVSAAELVSKFSRTIDIKGSYGGNFDVTPQKGPVEIDVPMDPPAANASSLFIKKESTRVNAELGDFVDYTITVKNVSINNTDINNVVVTDTLPKGFSYVAGTAKINKVTQDPAGGKGPILSFTIGNMGVNAESIITYRAHIGVGALHGDGINRAQAQGVTPINNLLVQSAVAVAKVKVSAGVFTQEAFVTGKVYTDCNRDGVQGVEEIGVPNVRLVLEDGSYVITDVEGKYNFYGLRATTHVLKLDRTTLPQDVELIEQNVRNAGDPSSRFVDLKAGELHRADFAITTDNGTCSGEAMGEIYARRNQGDTAIGELERALKTDLPFETSNPSDLRSLPANGCVNYTGNECGLHGKAKMPTLLSGTKKDNKEQEDVERVSAASDSRSLESYLEEVNNNQLDILNLIDGQILPYAQTRILFKGALGASFELSVNDKVLEEKSMAIKMAIPDTRTEAREYLGINLKAGENTIVLKQFDSLGNPRGVRVIHVSAPDNLANISIEPNQKVVEANGSNEILLKVKLLDKNGLPVTSRTAVTLESDSGRFRATDLDPKTQGIQLFIEGGEFTVKLVAPVQAGEAKVRISSGTLKAETNVRFVPELRPMIAAGIVEGMVSFKNFNPAKISPAYANDGFEAELQSLASSNDGKLNASGRAAMFLKGKVKGEYLLTLSYDSNKERDQRLFRDIRPDDYYPVYGDSAVRGFDAQSTSKLYVRLDKGRSYAMFGDYTTRIENSEGLSLGQYNRSLTGIRAHYATDDFTATTFVAQTKAKQKVIEKPALGISGPYTLDNIDGLKVNSEKVEIIKRDRNNLGLIIDVQPQARFTDYEFEPLTASIYFKTPVPSLDANLNPYFIRVTVEVEEESGEDYWLGGVQVEKKIGDKLTVGAATVHEDDPVAAYQLNSANAVLKLAENTKLIAEVAQSDRESKAAGQASRAELTHTQGRINARVYYGESDTNFENTASPLSSGRAESGVKLQVNMDSWGTLSTEAIRTENTFTGGVRNGIKATLNRTINQYLSAELGGRIYDETAVPANNSNLGVTPYEGKTVHTKLNIKIPKVEAASLYGEYEQDIDHSERKIIALGGDYRINQQSKLYARHELSSSLNGSFALNDQQQRNTTVVGIEGDYMKDGRVFSEYRVRDAVNAQDVEAAVGLRNRWYLTEGVRLNTNFEQVRTLEGSDSSDAIALSLGLEYLSSPLWKATGKVDLRWTDNSDTILNTLGLAYKWSRDWTLLGKNIFSLANNHGVNVGDRLQNRFQLGAAYRQVDTNRWDALTKIEYKLDDDQTSLSSIKEKEAYIFSTHWNYHPVRRWTFSNQYAAKWLTDSSAGISTDSFSYLIGGRVLHDITERWEASLQAGWLNGDIGGNRLVVGAETGYLVTTNLWLSLGYNWLSYDDADLVGTDFTVDGAYLRLRFKFDEDLFGANKPATNKALEPKNVGL